MRPKRRILLLCAHDHRASVLHFMLETNGFFVASAITSVEAAEYLGAVRWDLLICELPFEGIERLVNAAHKADPNMRSLVMAQKTAMECPANLSVDMFFPVKDTTSMELLERIRFILVRKRGPQKKLIASEPAPAEIAVDRRLA